MSFPRYPKNRSLPALTLLPIEFTVIRTKSINTIHSGRLISYPQVVVVLSVEGYPTIEPKSFLLTDRHLGVGCGQKWNEVVNTVQVGGNTDQGWRASGIQG